MASATGDGRSSHRRFVGLMLLAGFPFGLVAIAVLVAMAAYVTPGQLAARLWTPEVGRSLLFTLESSLVSTAAAVALATPAAYALSRMRGRRLRHLFELVVDLPTFVPPVVLGLGLLILFHTPLAGTTLETIIQRLTGWSVTYSPPAVLLAQFVVASSVAIRLLQGSFEAIPVRHEQIAWTLGCTPRQAFFRVVLPQARRGLVVAATIAWARTVGEFGPILVFAGITRGRTEVLSTTVYLELSTGRVDAAVAVALLMIVLTAGLLVFVRQWEPGARSS